MRETEAAWVYHTVKAPRLYWTVHAHLHYLTAATTIAAAAALASPAAATFKGANLAPLSSVTLAAARASALAARPGVITDQELEREAGGSGLRYSFDIKSKGKAFEVGVDARTGKLLENKAEGPHAD